MSDALIAASSRFAAEHFGVEAVRAARDGDTDGVRSSWAALADLGWSGALVSAERGGGGGCLADLAPLLEACGRALAVTPFVATSVVAPRVLEDIGSEAADGLSGAIVAGAVVGIEIEAFRQGSGLTLSGPGPTAVVAGTAAFVHAPVADHLLAVIGDDEPVLVAIPTSAPQVEVVPGILIDGTPVGRVTVHGLPRRQVFVGSACRSRLVGPAAAVAQALVLTGGARRALELTVVHLQQRHQFGVPLGAFQALQHRTADLHAEVELTAALTSRAVATEGDGTLRGAQLAHAALAAAAETYLRVAEEGVQLHGGMGMTDEAEIGFHLKAARVGGALYGDSAHHRSCYAQLRGY